MDSGIFYYIEFIQNMMICILWLWTAHLFQGNLRSYLLDPHGNDQFSVIYEGGDRVSIMMNSSNEPSVIEERGVSVITLLSSFV